MQLVHLRVAHLSKKLAPALDLTLWQRQGGFCLETCQRWIWIFDSQSLSLVNEVNLPPPIEFYQGKEAYQFLIRFACGLDNRPELMSDDVFALLTVDGSVQSRQHAGGTAPTQVLAAIKRGRADL